MLPLPESGLIEFEAWLRERWTWPSWFVRRGALAVSCGLLGLRWCEVEVMQPGDVLVEAGTLFVRTRKRGRPRTVEAPAAMLAAALAMRAEVAGGDDRVFVTAKGRGCRYQDVRRFVRSCTTKVFGRAFSFHCFRHTAAVRCHRRTGDVLAVQGLLGHTSLLWTNDYLRRLLPVELGGPIAFAGGGEVRKPRIFDPDELGKKVPVRAVASRRKAYGKGAGAGDQEVFEWDEERERKGTEKEEKHGRAAKAERDEFAVGGKWEGLSMVEAMERYEKEREAMSEEEAGREVALREQEARERVVAERSERLAVLAGRLRRAADRQVVKENCSHTELRERRRANGRHELWCKECGAFVCYAAELADGR